MVMINMDLKQIEDAILRFREMYDQYNKIDELQPLMQEAVKESLLQRFEYTQEIAWKIAKKYLVEQEGYSNDMGPKKVIRICGELNLLNAENWLLYLQNRQDISHDYSGAKAIAVLESIHEFKDEINRFYNTLKEKLQKNGGNV